MEGNDNMFEAKDIISIKKTINAASRKQSMRWFLNGLLANICTGDDL